MIQINRTPVPQKAQVQSTNSKEDTNGFQAIMEKTVSKLKSKDVKQAGSASSKAEDEKDINQQTKIADTAPAGADISALAAMLQQVSGQEQLIPAQMQATNEPQLSVLQAAEVSGQNTADPLGKQGVNPLTAAMAATTSAQANVVGFPTQLSTTTADTISNQPQTKPAVPFLAQGEMQTLEEGNTALLAEMKTKAEQTSQHTLAFAQAEDTQTASSQSKQINESVLEISQVAVQTPKSDSASQFVSNEQLQAELPAEEKTELPIQAAAGQDQNSAHFNNLFQTGNVVIKVSDASSNTAKAVCNQVTDQISINYKAGNPQFQMDLHPQDLGKVSVKLAMQSGVLTVEISAANPKTQSMLMASSDEIKSMLQSTASQPVIIMEPVQDETMYQQQNQSGQQQQQEQQQQHQNQRSYLSALDGDITTDDFLSVMQKLRQQASSV